MSSRSGSFKLVYLDKIIVIAFFIVVIVADKVNYPLYSL
jgi:hypothetical protein